MPTKFEVTKAVRASKLVAPARLVMFVLADVAETGTAEIPEQFTPSLRVLASETGLNESTVKRHLNALEAEGWVERRRPTIDDARLKGERTRYRLTIPCGTAVRDQGAEVAPEGAGKAQEGAEVAPQGAESAMAGRTPRPNKEEVNQQHNQGQSETSSAKPRRSKPEPPREDVERICKYLAEWIVKNGSKRPTITDKWRTEARLLIDKDGRPLDEIRQVIAWSQRDGFWKSNILSMPTLREKYDQLRLASERPSASPPTSNVRHIDDLSADERAARNPFANSVRASDVAKGAS
ncbi:helix-turn-helix domain-containing protein [Dactylosporangium sp. CA-052675]|uniref:helix-turn-helix domain-containing protein n=1 Tax=Dactylosporangium sp. CA-052675 TaxID=3239927 RepID=UPI003D937F4B